MATRAAEETTPRPAQSTKLTQARAGLAYLVNPATHPAPGSLVTRSSLKTFRYVLKFVFWRLVRYAVSLTPAARVCTFAGWLPDFFRFNCSAPEIRRRRSCDSCASRDRTRYSSSLARSPHRAEHARRGSHGRHHRSHQSASSERTLSDGSRTLLIGSRRTVHVEAHGQPIHAGVARSGRGTRRSSGRGRRRKGGERGIEPVGATSGARRAQLADRSDGVCVKGCPATDREFCT